MESFEELGLSPDVAAALAAEGIETPTSLQSAVLPVVLRGNNVVALGGPGSGTMVSWAAPLLHRIEPGGGQPRCVVAVPTGEIAEALAESLGRLAQHTGHRVSVLVGPWALPERCDILFGTTGQLRTASHDGRLDLASIETFIVERAQDMDSLGQLAKLDGLMEQLGSETQRVLVTLPQPDGVKDLVRARMARAVHAPTPASSAQNAAGEPVKRGDIRFFTVPSSRERWTLEIVARLLQEEDASHVIVYCRSEDRIVDVGDFLSLHGFLAGAPGDETVPVWLSADGLEARAAAEGLPDPSVIATVSCDAPMDVDALDRRHGWAGLATVVVLPREMAHLRAMAKEAGYKLAPLSLSVVAVPKDVAALRDELTTSVEEGNLGAEMLVLEPLLEEFSATELAAAALRIVRDKSKAVSAGEVRTAQTDASGARPFVRLFVSVGQKDDLSPRELLGALAGESGVKGDYFGRLDIRDTFSLVEVHPDVADQVIKGANGLTIKGRATRVDYDRGARKPAGGTGGGARTGGGRPGSDRGQPAKRRPRTD